MFYVSVCALSSINKTAFKLKKFLILQHLEERDLLFF